MAGLARIDLTPAELDRLAGELDVIVESVARVSEIATPDVPATSHPLPLTNVFRPDVPVEPVDRALVLASAPEHIDGKFAVPQILGEDAMSTTSRASPPPRSPRSWPPKEVSSVEATQAHLDRIADVDARGARVPARSAASRARRGGRRRRAPRRRGVAARARRRADRRQGRRRHQGPGDDRRLEDPRGLDPALRRDARREAQGRGPADPGQDQHGRVRHGVVHGALRVRQHPQPVGPRPHPRRLRRRLRRGGRRVRGAAGDRHGHGRLDPPARAPSPARSASSPPTAGCPATGSSRWRRRWTRPVPSPARSSTPRCCTSSSAATTRATRRRSTSRCPRSSPPPGRVRTAT